MVKYLVLVIVSLFTSGIKGDLYSQSQKQEISDEVTWKVVGGSQASTGQFPYIVSLRNPSYNAHFCGGSILNENWVVTAAHCMQGVSPYGIVVVAGTNTLSYGGTTYSVDEIQVHPSYSPYLGHKNDIALIRLQQPIEFSTYVQPIQIGQISEGQANECVLSGWGSTSLGSRTPNNLQYLPLRTVPNCSQYLPETDHSQICTFVGAGQGACHGDSGGPLASNNLLIGVVSYGKPCAKGVPDVFTNVAHFKSWIDGIISY